MTASTVTPTTEGPDTVGLPYHETTGTLATALRRLADDLMATGSRPITATALMVNLQVSESGGVDDSDRRNTTQFLANVAANGATCETGSGFYGNPNMTTARRGMWLHAYVAVEQVSA